MESLYSIRHLTKHYGEDQDVLKDISLEIEPEEIFVIIGPSGVGKTTLLKILDLIETPDEGDLLYKGKSLLHRSDRELLDARRKMGMVFQSTLLFDGSVESNVSYGLRLRNVPKPRIYDQTQKAMKTVGVESLAKRHVDTLSGGEAQRVAIARILAYEPDFLLLDEPTGNLDPSHTVKVEDAIRAARKEYGATVVLATHNMFQAKRLADRVAFLYEGRFIEIGDVPTIFTHPKEELTRKFMNGEIIF